jgi:hypothetical protein
MSETLPAMNSFPYVNKVIPLSDADAPLVRELAEVLKKHGASERFGLTLLHRHFLFSDDEMLLETTDVTNRVQTIKPVSKAVLANEKYIETAWRLDTGVAITSCVCIVRNGEHSGDHQHIPGR